MHLRNHYWETKGLLQNLSKDEAAKWLLEDGYFPERYVLPPSFRVEEFNLQDERYNKDISQLTRHNIATISYPKTLLNERRFGIIHPWNYHDIVFEIYHNWEFIIEKLFPVEQKIYSYSLPIPVTKKSPGRTGKLRAGRMIYEWLAMAEKDLVLDAGSYQLIARTDIANFYSSIYTHTIPWVLHGREESFKDKNNKLVGNRIDRLLQYSNDARTNGIVVGPSLMDLIAELILSNVDVEVSKRIGGSIDFVAARFKDDYRILCQTKENGQKILQHISNVLSEYNLVLNEKKTEILSLPSGIYRSHDREYFPYSLKRRKRIKFKLFEHTLLTVLEIHRKNPGTNILEKFVSELFNSEKKLKLIFSKENEQHRFQEIKKVIELLFFAKRESQKLLCHVLSVCEQLYFSYIKEFPELKVYLADRIKYELSYASNRESVFEVVWYIFFSRFVGLGITDFDKIVNKESIKENPFYKSIISSKQKIFNDSHINLFAKPKECLGESLAKQIAVFD